MVADSRPDVGKTKPAKPVPALTLRTRAVRLLARINDHRVLLIAAGVTYYLLLALVPSLTVFV